MKMFRIFFILLISLIPINTLRRLSYNFLLKYKDSKPDAKVIAITPTKYKNLISQSVYGI